MSRQGKSRVQGGWSSRILSKPVTVNKKDGGNCKESNFTFTTPEEPIREVPKERMISLTGTYDLSTEPSGLARIRLTHNFVENGVCNDIYNRLLNELPWAQQRNSKAGVSYLEPRLTAWFGDLDYKYSNVVQKANKTWHPVLNELKEHIFRSTGLTFNSMLANLYRDGHDGVDWHSDCEPCLGSHPTIASLSFGDTRNFEMRKKPTSDDQDYTFSERVKVPLHTGTLLIMEGASQKDWQHRIPKEYHDRSERINLTFRQIFPE